ncbi:flagellar biosynthesis protein [Roseovarius sp. M141]|uniref:FliH/SctL family protein n=1 Tax=Roseovarius sp. M141 TaxID=2583806 RepID=UPI0020CBB6E7|nr:flagellar biosynthesis protein [Roseovarius sp. M141]MCQ0091817.1 flagellar biosynthesis protein [Roseovarius sp. M141]
MTISHLLEDFSGGSDAHTFSISDVSLEEQRLEAFESGYKAGRDDAVKAASDDSSRIAADFAANLQDMSFTFQEAQSSLLTALRPLLTGMVNSVLPRLSRQTLGARVLETLDAMAAATTNGPIEITTAPQNTTVLQKILDEQGVDNVQITAEPSLGDGQVHIRANNSEQEIDLDAVLAQIDATVTGFFDDRQKDIA